MFAEVMRSLTGERGHRRLHHQRRIRRHLGGPRSLRGRAGQGCAGDRWQRIGYVGLQYYRGGINHQSFYTHTLPINWNRNTGNTATQLYTCGDSSFRRAHIAASSYHTGGANVCMGDGSVRFVRDAVDFTIWQNVGTRSGGEAVQNLD